MHATRYLWWLTLLVILTCWSPPVWADIIFFEDGYVLAGKIRREVVSEFDPISREAHMMPKGFTMIDDGPRRIYFSPIRVRIVEQTATATGERFVTRPTRFIGNPLKMPPILEVVEEGPWNYATWERDYFVRTPTSGKMGLKQGIGNITPLFARVDATTKVMWSAAYLTREWDADTLHKLLLHHADFKPNDKTDKKIQMEQRFRLCDFFAQAGFFDLTDRELDRLQHDFPDSKSRTENARKLLNKLRAGDRWERIKTLFHAGRFEAVAKDLDTFPTADVDDRVRSDMREMSGRLAGMKERTEVARQALDSCRKEAFTPAGKALASAAAVISKELHLNTAQRLDAFVGQVHEAERRKARKEKQAMNEEELLSLAVTGWLLGSSSAEARPNYAISLWKTRQLVLEYTGETDAAERKRIVTRYEKDITPRIDIDEVAQLIDTLPPVTPATVKPGEVVERSVTVGRVEYRYHLALPPEYTHTRHYPVLFVLHNSGEKATAALAKFQKLAAEHGYILVAPVWERVAGGVYNFSPREHDTVLHALRDIRRCFQVDSDRVFLFGFAEGGRMALDVGLAHPDLFAGLLPMGAGPSHYSRRYWRNAQHLPVYAMSGTRSGETGAQLREQFDNWITRGYPTLWIEYKGRGIDFFSAELPSMFDWMRNQRRNFPLRQLGSDGGGTMFGNEYCTLRPDDNRFYWVTVDSLSSKHIIEPDRWTNLTQPAALTASIDPATNSISFKSQGVRQATIWLGRDPKGRFMVDFDRPLTVSAGLRIVLHRQKVAPSLEVLLEDLYRRGDRKHLFVAKVELNLTR